MHTKIAIVVICLMLSCVHASPVDQNHHNGEQADTRLGYGVRQTKEHLDVSQDMVEENHRNKRSAGRGIANYDTM